MLNSTIFAAKRGLGAGPKSLLSLTQKRGIAKPAVNTSQLTEGRRTGALAMKVGMLSIYDKWGERHAVTALQLDNCQVVQVKTKDTEGYFALQLGVGEAKQGKTKVSLQGHYDRAGVEKPNRRLMEFRVTEVSAAGPLRACDKACPTSLHLICANLPPPSLPPRTTLTGLAIGCGPEGRGDALRARPARGRGRHHARQGLRRSHEEMELWRRKSHTR